MEKVNAPFTEEQVDNINKYQKDGKSHPFTCCSPDNISECNRTNNIGDTFEEKEGILIATKEGLVCPCGKYKQSWVYSFMTQ